MAKDKKDKSPKPQGSDENKASGGILFTVLASLTAIVIIVGIFGGAFYIIIHNNVNGIGEKYRINIEKYSLIKWMLPAVAGTVTEDINKLTPEQIKSRYIELKKNDADLKQQLDDAAKQIKDLQSVKADLDKANADNAQLKKDAADKESQMAAREKKLADDKKAVDALVAKGDPTGFKAYFEGIDSANAQKLYQEVVKQQAASDNDKKLAQLYETMDPASSAKILAQMGNAKIDLVVTILKNMKKEISSQILAAMDPVFAGKITEKLSSQSTNNAQVP